LSDIHPPNTTVQEQKIIVKKDSEMIQTLEKLNPKTSELIHKKFKDLSGKKTKD
jgi:hypothetical protein